MKDYYKVLELEKDADNERIRQAYRRLAKLYHPDINPQPDAHFKFAEINEAYSVLSDSEKRKAYDDRFLKAYMWMFEEMIEKSRATKTKRSMNDMVREARLKAEKAKEYQRNVDKKYYRTFRKKSVWILSGLLFFNLLVFADYFLPREHLTDTVVESDNKIRTEHSNFQISEVMNVIALEKGSEVEIVRTLLFKQNMSLSFYIAQQKISIDAEYNIFKGFIFVPVLIVIFGIIGLAFRKDDYLKYSLAMLSIMLFVAEIFFIYIST